MQGVVIKNTGNIYDVLDSEGVVWQCKVKGNFRIKGLRTTNPVAVGDHVSFEIASTGSRSVGNRSTESRTAGSTAKPVADSTSSNSEIFHWITSVGERKNCLLRKSVNLSKQTHIIAANIDLAIVVASMHEPRTPQGFIDRTLISCEAYNVNACIVFNKVDIYPQAALQKAELYKEMYERAGYKVLLTSALTGAGIDELRNTIKGKAVLFTGNSGVGKSALLNTIDPSLNLKTGLISGYNEKGRHTTTFAQMFPITFPPTEQPVEQPAEPATGHPATYLIDTPGIKEFGMIKINTEELSQYFPEMESIRHNCAYSNCTHTHEPNCAVKAAVEAGKISPLRYQSYLNILSGEEVPIPSLLENKSEKK